MSYGSGALPSSESHTKWISQQLEKRIEEYTIKEKHSIFCGSWNVNGRVLPETCDLREWLRPKGSELPDVYCIGLQEMVDLTVMNVAVSGSDAISRANSWSNLFQTALNTPLEAGSKANEGYTLVVEKHMVGLLACVFVRDRLFTNISEVQFIQVGTGAMGFMGNKGGIVLRMHLFDSPMCFIIAHFQANRENVVGRNADFQIILDAVDFVDCKKFEATAVGEGAKLLHRLSENRVTKIEAHEHIFWTGDLNYRINGEIETQEVFDLVAAGDLTKLIEYDQLNQERASENSFQGFQEAPITFPPTYKFAPGTDNYDQKGKKRAPAWCDRILWRSKQADMTTCVQYDRSMLNHSDHKPVYALFDCSVRIIEENKLKTLYQALLRQIDAMVNASAPKLIVDGRMMDFGTVTSNRKVKRAMTVRNEGSVLAEWLFVPKNDEEAICKSWLKLKPEDGVLAPGESIEVEVTIDISDGESCTLFGENPTLEMDDILVFRVSNGSDMFCIVSAKFDAVDVDLIKYRHAQSKITEMEEEERQSRKESNDQIFSTKVNRRQSIRFDTTQVVASLPTIPSIASIQESIPSIPSFPQPSSPTSSGDSSKAAVAAAAASARSVSTWFGQIGRSKSSTVDETTLPTLSEKKERMSLPELSASDDVSDDNRPSSMPIRGQRRAVPVQAAGSAKEARRFSVKAWYASQGLEAPSNDAIDANAYDPKADEATTEATTESETVENTTSTTDVEAEDEEHL